MKQLIDNILEKLVINKHSKAKNNLPEGFRNDPLELPNNRVKFPIIIKIDNKYYETLNVYKIDTNKINNNIRYKFYSEADMNSSKPTVTMTEQELMRIFDDERGVMLNTIYGWLEVKWEK